MSSRSSLAGFSIADRIIQFRVALVVGAVVLLLASAAAAAAWLRVDFTPQRIFESDGDEFTYLKELQDQFGHEDDLLLVHVHVPEGVLTPAGVDLLERLHTRLAAVPEIERVDDLTTAWVVRRGRGPTRLLEPGADLAEVASTALADPLLVRRFISADGKSALVAAHVAEGLERYDQLLGPVEACAAIVDGLERPPGVELSTTGVPVARVRIAQSLMKDQATFFPICAALFLGILWLLFRDVRAVLLPLVAVGFAIVYTTGFLAVSGQSIDIINNVIPILIFVIGISDAIHLLVRYRHELEDGRPQREALRVTIRHLMTACFLTSFTTAAGFGSLASARIDILKRFGLSAAVGVMIAYGVVVILVPAVLSMWKPTLSPAGKATDRRIQDLSEGLGVWVAAHRWTVLVVGGIGLLVAAGFASQVHEENNIYEAFPSDSPLVLANDRLERDFMGIVPISLVVRWDEGTTPLEPAALAYLVELEAALQAEGFPSFSILDLLRETNCAREGGDPAARRLPTTKAEAFQLFSLLQLGLERAGRGGELSRLIQPEARALRLTAQGKDEGARILNARFERIDRLLEQTKERQRELGLTCRLSGGGPVASRGVNTLILDLFGSLLLAFAVIFPTMCLLLRSFRAGLVSMIPNVTPLLLTLGFMGAVGMDLRVTSVIVFSVSLGLAVDDTIHFMARFRAEWAAEPPPPVGDAAALDAAYVNALMRTFRGTGGAIVTTTVLLAAGYSALLASGFPITRVFGLCMEVTVIGALIGDLFLLPVCLLIFKPFPVARDQGAERPAEPEPAV
ncbi:MAG: MMPL family transporter [Planctomycetes bacterium]|nr:MMPL family transporter [Planctomycetota bacterium]